MKHYIEFRVELKDDVNGDTVQEVANYLQDTLADMVSDEFAPPIFTQEVTYEVVRTK